MPGLPYKERQQPPGTKFQSRFSPNHALRGYTRMKMVGIFPYKCFARRLQLPHCREKQPLNSPQGAVVFCEQRFGCKSKNKNRDNYYGTGTTCCPAAVHTVHAIINHIYDIGIKESDLVHTYIHTYIRRFCSKVVRAYAFISVVFFRDAHAAHTLSLIHI